MYTALISSSTTRSCHFFIHFLAPNSFAKLSALEKSERLTAISFEFAESLMAGATLFLEISPQPIRPHLISFIMNSYTYYITLFRKIIRYTGSISILIFNLLTFYEIDFIVTLGLSFVKVKII